MDGVIFAAVIVGVLWLFGYGIEKDETQIPPIERYTIEAPEIIGDD